MPTTAFLTLVFSATCLVQAGEPPDRGINQANPLQTLVGDYYFGDGLGVNCSLRIRTEGRFEFESAGCLGVYDCDTGEARIVEGHLLLTPRKFNFRKIVIYLRMVRDGLSLATAEGKCKLKPEDVREIVISFVELVQGFVFGGPPKDLIPVRWGERQFLVPWEEGRDFCNCVNKGLVSLVPSRNFYLRSGDDKKKADGLPDVPAAWRPMLLTRPVYGKVIDVLPGSRARVDLGAESGVWKGMELWIDTDGFGWAEVVDVGPRSCLIQIHREEKWARKGRSVGSRKPDGG